MWSVYILKYTDYIITNEFGYQVLVKKKKKKDGAVQLALAIIILI